MDSVMTMASMELSSPPKPPLAFRVAILGHRPNRLPQADLGQLGQMLRLVLESVQQEVDAVWRDNQELFAPEEPRLRAISPLAEGTDRLFAEQAIDLGWSLCCVMPFPQAEFEQDFAPGKALETDSLQRFRGLLAQAEQSGGLTCFELDGSRDDRGAAYGAGGRVVLNQADLLVVVWDGRRLGKRGGTEETFDEARRRGLPVVWIEAQAPHNWQCLSPGQTIPVGGPDQRVTPDGTGSSAGIRRMVREMLLLPEPLQPEHGAHGESHHRCSGEALKHFYRESQPKRTLAVVWKAFRDLLGDTKLLPQVTTRVEPFEQAVELDWPRNQDTPVARLVNRLRPFFAWPDRLAVLYSDRYRSAFILAFLLAALAVGMALLPVGFQMSSGGKGEFASTLAELLAIGVILLLVRRGRSRTWHERWIDYRLLAELIRHLRLVVPLGGDRPPVQAPAHHATYGQPHTTWMDWYVRAVTRAIELPNTVIDRTYLFHSLSQLDQLLADQVNYHQKIAQRCHNIEHRLHLAGLWLMGLTLFACGLHLLHMLLPASLLTFFCGFFPALGAALAGINNQGEFRRITRRSQAMQQYLGQLRDQVKALQEHATETQPGQTSLLPKAGILAADAARLLVAEVLDWRVVFLDRPFEPPA